MAELAGQSPGEGVLGRLRKGLGLDQLSVGSSSKGSEPTGAGANGVSRRPAATWRRASMSAPAKGGRQFQPGRRAARCLRQHQARRRYRRQFQRSRGRQSRVGLLIWTGIQTAHRFLCARRRNFLRATTFKHSDEPAVGLDPKNRGNHSMLRKLLVVAAATFLLGACASEPPPPPPPRRRRRSRRRPSWSSSIGTAPT